MIDLSVIRSRLVDVFQEHPVRLAYLFGSQSTGHTHEESDIDVGAFLAEKLTAEERYRERMRLIGELSQLFQTDRVDIVVLNDASPLLADEVLQGDLIYCADEMERIRFQVRALQLYEDTAPLRRLLAEAMDERIRKGTFGDRVFSARDRKHVRSE